MTTFLSAWLTVASLFTLVTLSRLVRRSRSPVGRRARRAVLLRPVDAPSAQEVENLGTRVPGVASILVSPFRPRLTEGVRWLPSDPLLLNRKLGHLQYALAVLEADSGPVLVADADVRVDQPLVDALLAGLDAGAELAWAAPRPLGGGLVRALLVQSLHSFEVLDVMSNAAKPVCGKAFALGPRAIEVLKGLPDCVGEDLELAQALHLRKLKVTLAGEATMAATPSSTLAVVARFTRWMQVLKAHRPALFPTIPLLFACTPALAVAAAIDGSTPLLLGVLAMVSLRAAVAAVLERRAGLFFAWLTAEVLLAVCWVNALVLGSRVTWRGRELKVGSRGRLSAVVRPGVAP